MRTHLYQTPDGYTDIPFIYTFDGRNLTPGSSPQNLIVSIQEDDFLLRSVAGLSTVAAQWQLFDQAQMERISQPWATSNRWTVAPESKYPAQSQIRFNLGTVAIATNGSGNNIGFVGFCGVKRAPKGKFGWADYQSSYEYWERQFTYTLPITLNYYADQGAASRQFSVEISDGDFELQSISICRQDVPGVLPADPFRITLYDPSGYNQLSTQPVSPRWVNWLQNNWGSSFPSPCLVYPVQSQIKVEIESLINLADGPQQYQIVFTGVERMPC